MIRHRSIAIVLLVAGITFPGDAHATTFSSVQSAFRFRTNVQSSFPRIPNGGRAAPYIVETIGGASATKSFTTLSQAQAYAKGLADTAILSEATGQIISSTITDPYEAHVTTFPGNITSSLDGTTYPTLSAAESALAGVAEASVTDRLSGAVLFSTMDNYLLVTPSGALSYQTFEDAKNAAQQEQGASIESLATGQSVWIPLYEVLISGSFAREFATLANAQTYSTSILQSVVVDLVTGQTISVNTPQYSVYQNGVMIKQFANLADALAFAKGLPSVTVMDLATQQAVYTNVPNYLVEVGAKVLKSFVSKSAAIAYAKKITGAVVIELSDNQIVYSSAGPYGVYRYLQLVRSFTTLSDAIAYAKTLDHAQVIETATHKVDFSNYPTVVKSPYGDTFTVQNGDVVDSWGKVVTALAPAPAFMQTGRTYVSNDYSHWYEVSDSSYVYVGEWENPYQTLNLETRSTLTAAQINAFIAAHAASQSVLQNAGNYFIEAQNTYGVNAEYLVAHAIIESAWGTSYFAQNRNNLFGYEAYTSNPNAAASFRSIEYDINFQAWFVRSDYLNSSGSFFNGANLDGMNVDYATDAYWANSIGRVMSEMETYSTSLATQPLMGESSTRAVFAYPVGAKGQLSKATSLYATPADGTAGQPQVLGSIARGVILAVYGDSPGWDKVTTSAGMIGFVNWDNVTLQNMGEVINIDYGNSLNVRSTPTAISDANIVDHLPNNVYVVILSAGPTGWLKVIDSSGKTGYVSSQYIKIIH